MAPGKRIEFNSIIRRKPEGGAHETRGDDVFVRLSCRPEVVGPETSRIFFARCFVLSCLGPVSLGWGR